ncbi:hypothetical protein BJY04DRAFT_233116 [Aspergillus karnatakaensis]|uniref:type I polyketide synthase n=1 Tax=Aspergillus karnatakaensis TaxID=1810916 RepID=UPI003CCCD893
MAAVMTTQPPEPLAIIGLSLNLPGGATTAETFWDLILKGRPTSKEVPKDRYDIDAWHHPDANQFDRLSHKCANFLEQDLSRFDAAFFSISGAEVEAMDPQQRLLLETSYRAFENAGLSIDSLSGSRTAVYTGSFGHDYQGLQGNDIMTLPKFHATGTSSNMLANRVSWFFNLEGPSANVDTACSSSLMAIHLVCQSIWSKESSMGLALGCNTILSLETGLALDNLGLLSKDGRSYSFDERANGYARGEGVAGLVIRPLKDAIANGDTVRAIIRSSGSNQDGRTPGVMQPSQSRQEQLIRDTYAKAGLDLGVTRYVEAHGTGTAVGDPIEARAIGNLFRQTRSSNDPLYLGSVKSTVGHLEGASGVAGAIKAILAVEKGIIPPNTDLQNLNPRIDQEFYNIKVPREATPWPETAVRRASVSSFGFGGTNVHIVLDNAPSSNAPCSEAICLDAARSATAALTNGGGHLSQRPVQEVQDDAKILVWSTSDKDGAVRVKEAWGEYFASDRVPPKDRAEYLTDLAYTLSMRRSFLEWRTFAIVQPGDAWGGIVENMSNPMRSIPSPNVAYVFTGQGAQWYGMGRELFKTYPVFLNSIREAAAYLCTLGCSWDLLEELCKPETESRVTMTEFSQTTCTAVQVALVDLLRDLNVMPKMVVGHSSGEIAAAYACGAISRQSAWKIAFLRGQWSSKLEQASSIRGSMLAVALPQKEAQGYLERVGGRDINISVPLTVACVNSPRSVTISGEEAQIDSLKALLDAEKIFCRKLRVKVAYHSAQMQGIASQYLEAMGALERPIKPLAPRERPQMASSVTGGWIEPEELAQGEYWVRNMVSPVRFSDAVTIICSGVESPTKKLDGSHRRRLKMHNVIEIGPHSALQGPVQEILHAMNASSITYSSTVIRNVSAISSLLTVVGNLYSAGYPVAIAKANRLDTADANANHTMQSLNDLPEYPFNHSKSYWHESRISRNQRRPVAHKNELLGTPDPNWNPNEPRWRHIIRDTLMPWVGDHRINGSILYPATGMIAMPIEAARQLSRPGRKISGFNIQKIRFVSALKITEGEPVETDFHMRPLENLNAKDSDSFDFTLYSYVGSGWLKNCTGTIRVEYAPEVHDTVNGTRVEETLLKTRIASLTRCRSDCSHILDIKHLYPALEESGYMYGDAFQRIVGLSSNPQDGNTVLATITNYECTSDITIHPAPLDSIIQTALCVATEYGSKRIPLHVPTFIERLWIAAEEHPSASEAFTVVTSARFDLVRGMSGSMTAFNPTGTIPVIILDGLQCTMVRDGESSRPQESAASQLCSKIEWHPDIRLLRNEQLQALFHKPCSSSRMHRFLQLQFVVMARVFEALCALSKQGLKPEKPYVENYLDWARTQQNRLERGESALSQEPWRSRLDDQEYIYNLENELLEDEQMAGVAKFPVTVCRNLVDLLSNALEPLQFFFSSDLIVGHYEQVLALSNMSSYLESFLKLASHTKPDLRVLEIGAGTGAFTETCIRAIGAAAEDGSGARYSQWDYTDISRSFFGKAAERFGQEGARMVFKQLDIEKDPREQGFETGAYDIVIAGWVLHATASLENSLTNARKLLKPGGKLVFAELTNVMASAATFGLMEGWWLSSESYRKHGPCVDRFRWHELLLQTGFSGCDAALPDFDDPTVQENDIIISTAVEDPPCPTNAGRIEIVFDDTVPLQSQFAQSLQSELQAIEAVPVECVSLEGASTSSDRVLRIFLLELNAAFLYEVDRVGFEHLQQLFVSRAKTLWVTYTSQSAVKPKLHLVDGLFRALRAEYERQDWYTLALEGEAIVASVLEMVNFIRYPPASGLDAEYVVREGTFITPRLVDNSALNTAVSAQLVEQYESKTEFGCGIPVTLDEGGSSLLNGLKFVEMDAVGTLGDRDVEVQIMHVGLNFLNVLVALGQVPPITFGQEATGVVTRVGRGCTQFQEGDRVVGFLPRSFSSRAVFTEGGYPVTKFPPDCPSATAAAIPINFVTAYFGLKECARIQPGDAVLIHSGAGGTGQAAIQLAHYFGATVYTTVGSEEKKQFIMEHFQIPEERIYSSRTTAFADAIKHVTGGRGVDIVLNSLAGEALLKSWECLALQGRFVELGKKDMIANSNLPMHRFLTNVSFSGFDLQVVLAQSPARCQAILQTIMNLLAEGKIHAPKPVTIYGIGELEKAMRVMQSGKTRGKLVIEMRPRDRVTALLRSKPNSSFARDATYVVAGGSGGLGQSIINWLVSRGARHLLLLSRSGASDPEMQAFLLTLRGLGVTVATPACDITDLSALQAAVHEAQAQLPPIKGCIQAAMVLDDTTFESMSYEAWQAAVRPKAQGSWNLHNALPRGLDFFVMFASICGLIGNPGQTNYAAGNTFQDALAHHRNSINEHGTSLDLGIFVFTGRVARDPKLLAKALELFPQEPVTERQFHAILDCYCSPSACREMQLVCQPCVGMRAREGAVAAPFWLQNPIVGNLLKSQVTNPGSRSQRGHGMGINLTTALAEANSLEEAAASVAKALTAKLSSTLSIEESDLVATKPLYQYGVDSLVAVELRNWFAKEVQADIATFDIIGRATIASLALEAASRSRLAKGWS